MFEEYLTRWGLTPDGEPMITHSSRLLPVRRNDVPAMLKIADDADEKLGGVLMTWWDSDGAARVLEYNGDALLLERAEGQQSLIEMSRNGRDDDACKIICQVIAKLHQPRDRPVPSLIPLMEWFRDLWPAAEKHGGILLQSAAIARELLANPQDEVVLHGDIHHGNILDFGERGWLAIDPKHVYGERGFDYANLFSDPDIETATAPGRLARRATIIASAANLDRKRLLQWVLAQSGLSVAWSLSDDEAGDFALAIASQAVMELDKE